MAETPAGRGVAAAHVGSERDIKPVPVQTLRIVVDMRREVNAPPQEPRLANPKRVPCPALNTQPISTLLFLKVTESAEFLDNNLSGNDISD